MKHHSSNPFFLSRSFASPLLAVIFMVLGSAFFMTFLTLLLDERGYTKEQIGLLQSSYFLGMFLGSFKMESLMRRIGHIQSLSTFGSLGTCALLLQGLYPIFWVWMLLRFLFGLSIAALYIVIESWLLHFSTPKTRGAIMALYMISITASSAVAQQLLNATDIQSSTPFLLAALFTSLSVIPVSLSTTKIILPQNPEYPKFLTVFKISPFGVTLCFATGLLFSAIQTFFPILSLEKEIPVEQFMGATLAGGIFLQWPIGKLSDRFERRKCILATLAVTLVLTLTAYFSSKMGMGSLLTLTFCLGGLISTLYPLSVSLVCDHLPEERTTTAISFLLLAYGLGSILGPVASSTVIGALGNYALYLYFSAILVGVGVMGIYSTVKRPVAPEELHSPFIPLTSTTPVVLEIDPRGEANK